ncbi:MAG: PAC2 family protein, partial [Candidatus Omnitrophica bacterium]|nr:PAC2 family protein [Candidatus Omnitrophota bacterium]
GMGDVALKCANYLVENLKAEVFASMNSADYFYPISSIIKKGILSTKDLPGNYFYYWKNLKAAEQRNNNACDLIIFTSNAQPDMSRAEDYVENILEIARLYKVKSVVSFAAMPAPIDHTQVPDVWYAATNKELLKNLDNFGLKLMNEGDISGLNGLFLGLAKKSGFPGYCLLGEIPIYTIQIENPRAVSSILNKLKLILGLPLEFKTLEKQVEFIEAEISKLVEYLKEGIALPVDSGPISEAEIEKIKKALIQLTHLPQSIKEKIEKLFDLAKKDIGKANELKQELDNWSVYKEYEDRFLDLFKKSKDKGN